MVMVSENTANRIADNRRSRGAPERGILFVFHRGRSAARYVTMTSAQSADNRHVFHRCLPFSPVLRPGTADNNFDGGASEARDAGTRGMWRFPVFTLSDRATEVFRFQGITTVFIVMMSGSDRCRVRHLTRGLTSSAGRRSLQPPFPPGLYRRAVPVLSSS